MKAGSFHDDRSSGGCPFFHCFSVFMDISRRFAHGPFYFHDICITAYIMDPFFFDFHDMENFAYIVERVFSDFHDIDGFADIAEFLLAGFHGIDGFCISRGRFLCRLPRDGRFLRIPWNIPSPASTGSTGSAYTVDMYEGATSADARP